MKIFTAKRPLSIHLDRLRAQGKRIGLVPTMGALHQGHLALLKYIDDHCDIRVCSIFVNPTQFNNTEDLEMYPRPREKDLQLLEDFGCEVVFMPEVQEMYVENEEWHIDLGALDQVLEGAFRPGHYQGVTQIVKKLFDITEPDVACFGQKDFQQYLVIEKMVANFKLPIKLLMCPTVREGDGLALSSRNVRLSDEGHQTALVIIRALTQLSREHDSLGLEEAKSRALNLLMETADLKVEYLEVCDVENLLPVTSLQVNATLIALTAVWVDGVRLIDNIIFKASPKINIS